jgi:hypothetical protein
VGNLELLPLLHNPVVSPCLSGVNFPGHESANSTPTAKKPRQLEYLLFGKGQEFFLAHLITKAPDFDQVLSVATADHAFSDEELAKGVHVIFPGKATAKSPSVSWLIGDGQRAKDGTPTESRAGGTN